MAQISEADILTQALRDCLIWGKLLQSPKLFSYLYVVKTVGSVSRWTKYEQYSLNKSSLKIYILLPLPKHQPYRGTLAPHFTVWSVHSMLLLIERVFENCLLIVSSKKFACGLYL